MSDLPNDGHYYATGTVGVTRRLPFVSCEGQQSGESVNAAIVQLSTRLFAGEMYGWQILTSPPRLGVEVSFSFQIPSCRRIVRPAGIPYFVICSPSATQVINNNLFKLMFGIYPKWSSYPSHIKLERECSP